MITRRRKRWSDFALTLTASCFSAKRPVVVPKCQRPLRRPRPPTAVPFCSRCGTYVKDIFPFISGRHLTASAEAASCTHHFPSSYPGSSVTFTLEGILTVPVKRTCPSFSGFTVWSLSVMSSGGSYSANFSIAEISSGV